MWTDPLERYKINKEKTSEDPVKNYHEKSYFEMADKEKIANLLILYLKQNDMYDDIRKKVYIRDVVTHVSDPMGTDEVASFEYDVTFKRTITIEGSNYIRSIEDIQHYYEHPEKSVLNDGEIGPYNFEQELKSNEEFLAEIIRVSHLTPLGLVRNANSILVKDKIRELDRKIADLEEQIYHTKLIAELEELKKAREELMSSVKVANDIEEPNKGMSY